MKDGITVEEAASYKAKDISEIKKRLQPYVDRLVKHGNQGYSGTEKLVIRKMYRAIFFEQHIFRDNPSRNYKKNKIAKFGGCSFCTRTIMTQLDLFLKEGIR